MTRRRYDLPKFLDGTCSRADYIRWLDRKARAHVKRDRGRGNTQALQAEYKEAIHRAVLDGGEKDAYTGEVLDWSLISTYDNRESKRGGRAYKRNFALLPTVDHVGDGLGAPDFRICSWRTNDAKSDLEFQEFLALCNRVVEYNQPKSGPRVTG